MAIILWYEAQMDYCTLSVRDRLFFGWVESCSLNKLASLSLLLFLK
ncbi:MAG: hypothetical protein RID09_30755 [Coleofasciculus sp. G1-WW12-02]